jgi:hypothetical protein
LPASQYAIVLCVCALRLSQVQCDSCYWWLHYECSESGCDIQELRSSPVAYECPVCRVHAVDIANVSVPKRDSNLATVAAAELFILVKRTGRHKVCRGCGPLREPSTVPNDFLLRHKESYTYFNKKERVTKTTYGNRFYHTKSECVKKNWPNIGEIVFAIPLNLKSSVSHVHMKHFLKCGLITQI